MAEVTFIQHRDQQVLLMDLSHLNEASLTTLTDNAIAAVRSTGVPHSVLALLDLAGTPVNKALSRSLRRGSENNGPFIRAMAFVGLGVMPRSLLKALFRASKRTNHQVFRTKKRSSRLADESAHGSMIHERDDLLPARLRGVFGQRLARASATMARVPCVDGSPWPK